MALPASCLSDAVERANPSFERKGPDSIVLVCLVRRTERRQDPSPAATALMAMGLAFVGLRSKGLILPARIISLGE